MNPAWIVAGITVLLLAIAYGLFFYLMSKLKFESEEEWEW